MVSNMVSEMRPPASRSPRRADELPPTDTAVDGDAGSYLEELLEDGVASAGSLVAEAAEAVELTGPHLRLAGNITLGRFRRLSDLLNHHQGLLLVQDTTILRRNGSATRVTTPSIWVNPAELTLIGQASAATGAPPAADTRIAKETRVLVVVTPGHTMTGEVFIPVGGMLDVFIESVDPPFVPMTNVRTRSLADRRIVTQYGFALLNRRHIVAATEAPAGLVVDRRSL
jgi:hypothetical protein